MPINAWHSNYAVASLLRGLARSIPYSNNSNDDGAVDIVWDNAIVVALKTPKSSHGIGTRPSCQSLPHPS